MATDEDFVRVRQNVEDDPLVEQWYGHLKNRVTDSLENQPLITSSRRKQTVIR